MRRSPHNSTNIQNTTNAAGTLSRRPLSLLRGACAQEALLFILSWFSCRRNVHVGTHLALGVARSRMVGLAEAGEARAASIRGEHETRGSQAQRPLRPPLAKYVSRRV
jgi:hypothetical protein